MVSVTGGQFLVPSFVANAIQCFSDMVPYCPWDSKYTCRDEARLLTSSSSVFVFYVVNFHKIMFKESFVYFLEEVKTENHCGIKNLQK